MGPSSGGPRRSDGSAVHGLGAGSSSRRGNCPLVAGAARTGHLGA
jgi:hypothetical protein